MIIKFSRKTYIILEIIIINRYSSRKFWDIHLPRTTGYYLVLYIYIYIYMEIHIYTYVWVCVQSLKSYLTLCNPMNCNLPGSSAHGILQARILEWIATPSSRGSSWPRGQTCFSCVYCTAGGFFTTESLWKPLNVSLQCFKNYGKSKSETHVASMF